VAVTASNYAKMKVSVVSANNLVEETSGTEATIFSSNQSFDGWKTDLNLFVAIEKLVFTNSAITGI